MLAIKTRAPLYHYSRTEKTLNAIGLKVEKGSLYGFPGPNPDFIFLALRMPVSAEKSVCSK